MNLPYTYQLLIAAADRDGSIKFHGSRADTQVRLMSSAGLIDGTFTNDNVDSFTSITRILAPGRAFLRAFKGIDTSGSDEKARAASRAATVGKWSANFGSSLFLFKEQIAFAESATRALAAGTPHSPRYS